MTDYFAVPLSQALTELADLVRNSPESAGEMLSIVLCGLAGRAKEVEEHLFRMAAQAILKERQLRSAIEPLLAEKSDLLTAEDKAVISRRFRDDDAEWAAMMREAKQRMKEKT